MKNDRVEKLRLTALNRKIPDLRSDEWRLLWYRGWMESFDDSNIVRKAKSKAAMFRYSTPIIDENELIVGKPNYRQLDEDEQKELDHYINVVAKAMMPVQGQASHMAINHEMLLQNGVSGILKTIEVYRDRLNPELPEDIEKVEFYKACRIVLEALAAYSENYADYAQTLALEYSGTPRHDELMEIARVCRKVPLYPAQTFREALQSIHFVNFCLEGLYPLGRPDRYLYEYYKNDIENRIISKESAQELIDCISIMMNEYIQKGLAIGYMVGGRDKNGKDVTNELTFMFIESIGHTRLIYPSVGLCYTPDTPKELLKRSCELLSEGLSHPALFNDDVIIKGLMEYGLPNAEACQYIHSTCVEITPIASSAVWVASPYINLALPLFDLMSNNSAHFENIDEVKAEYRRLLSQVIKDAIINMNYKQMKRYHHGGDPLVSCFVNDCLKKGKDIDQGGARYNWIMPSFVGLANLADSFTAIKKLVFDDKRYTINELNEILLANFEGHEDLRLEILNRIPKYGNDDDEADLQVQEITGWILEEIKKYKTYRGDRFIPSLFCWVAHERFGAKTLATPDGRREGFPLGDGSGPAQGREIKGPTAAVLSSTKWDHHLFIGGIAVNMKFGKSMFRGESIDRIMNLIETFMERGGFEMQVNVVDKETLLKARKNPEAYRDLVVRVGGYSDYFVHLSPAMQEEIILRTEHEI